MRIIPFLVTAGLATGATLLFNTRLPIAGNEAPAFGKFLSPQHGFWQNAEKSNKDHSAELTFTNLKGKVDVYMDERLVPHIFADQELDAYFVQGYLHAKYRLWQMEFQTYAAGGRLCEILGDGKPGILSYDRNMRRLGMVYAAEIAVKEVEKDPVIKSVIESYNDGVNSYIASLTESSLPFEYKLLGYKPEKWTQLKTALFLKYMSYDLAGADQDFEMTNAYRYFSKGDFDLLFPAIQDSLDPIIPKGTIFPSPAFNPKPPVNADSVYFGKANPVTAMEVNKPHPENGSNNWAVAGSKTKSGAPILCNDPHLGLNLPSLWYEVQISTPAFNAYGVSFPGAPGVIIGFNDSCAFGFTNGGRDVRDYYQIRFKDESRNEYWFNNAWKKTEWRKEVIRIKGKPDYIDSIPYTVFGPVMFDKTFNGGRQISDGNYAVRWKAHDPSNEMKIFYQLNHAKNYNDYVQAALNLHTPGQNCLFACKNGDVAIRTQGEWPAKWKGQGDFVMPGTDSSYMWQGMIPENEVPFQYLTSSAPGRGFVSSANQKPVDDVTYPYYMGRNYPPYRGYIINKKLASMNNITADDMMKLQVDNTNALAWLLMPLIEKQMPAEKLAVGEQKYFDILRKWNRKNDPAEKGATVFDIFWHNLADTVLRDEFAKSPAGSMFPFESTIVESLLKDSSWKFVDDINTTQRETLRDMMLFAFRKSCVRLQRIEMDGKLDWAAYKGTHVDHLSRVPALSRLNLPIGGGTHSINATKDVHGPSWRMVISLTANTEAYGVYPGGQNGNPGSKYYDSFVDDWAAGKYYTLWVMKENESADKRVIAKMQFGPKS